MLHIRIARFDVMTTVAFFGKDFLTKHSLRRLIALLCINCSLWSSTGNLFVYSGTIPRSAPFNLPVHLDSSQLDDLYRQLDHGASTAVPFRGERREESENWELIREACVMRASRTRGACRAAASFGGIISVVLHLLATVGRLVHTPRLAATGI